MDDKKTPRIHPDMLLKGRGDVPKIMVDRDELPETKATEQKPKEAPKKEQAPLGNERPHVREGNAPLTKRAEFLRALQEWLIELFDFRTDKGDDFATIDQVREDAELRGTKLWILICAILVASLGLNLNSTAVIIGAMLISPLMGPIIGFGTAIGIADFDLLKRSLRNLASTTIFSILTATVFFLLTPITMAGSELLGRTQPSIYDVLIAFFGGAAGMIAVSTKSKGQVLPGVAIATALMPPLCTVGYSIANGHWAYMAGALYLYLINSIFIALATFVVVRVLRFPYKSFESRERGVKVRRIVASIALVTIIPSIYLGVVLVRDGYREQRVESYVRKELNQPQTQVVRHSLVTERGKRILDVVLLGRPYTDGELDTLRLKMADYGLSKIALRVHQGFNEQEATDVGELRSVVLKDLYENSDRLIQQQAHRIDSLNDIIAGYERFGELEQEIAREIKVLFPAVKNAFIASTVQQRGSSDSLLRVVVQPADGKPLTASDRQRIKDWLKTRTQAKAVSLVIDTPQT